MGSDDFDIRVFKNDTILEETSETDAVIRLMHIEGKRFAYALANGTLGVYEGINRIWRIKVWDFCLKITSTVEKHRDLYANLQRDESAE